MIPVPQYIHYVLHMVNGTLIEGNIRLLGSSKTVDSQILATLTHIPRKAIKEITYTIQECTQDE